MNSEDDFISLLKAESQPQNVLVDCDPLDDLFGKLKNLQLDISPNTRLSQNPLLLSEHSSLFEDDEFMSLLKTDTPPPTVSDNQLDIFLKKVTYLHLDSNTFLSKDPPPLPKRSSLFYKCLCAKVKVEKHKIEKLKRVYKILRLDQPNSWYSINHPSSWWFAKGVPATESRNQENLLV